MEIKIGSTNKVLVIEIQTKLGITADGDFGPKTEAAIKAFQTNHGLPSTGIVGPNTAAKLGINFPEEPVTSSTQLTVAQVKAITNIQDEAQLELITQSINDTLWLYQINTRLRICHFLAQVLHESGGLTITKENLNYSASGLLRVFPRYFTADQAKAYEKQPQKIASRVYANRMGNGNEASQDGWRYKGRGYIQLTGRQNYSKLSTDLKVDFINNPDLLMEPKYAAMSAGWFWNSAGLNSLADNDDIKSITKRINGGYNGLEERMHYLAKVKAVIK